MHEMWLCISNNADEVAAPAQVMHALADEESAATTTGHVCEIYILNRLESKSFHFRCVIQMLLLI